MKDFSCDLVDRPQWPKARFTKSLEAARKELRQSLWREATPAAKELDKPLALALNP